MTNSFPEQVVICGTAYDVVLCERVVDVDVASEASLVGQIAYDEHQIRLATHVRGRELPVDVVWQALFHEVLHGIFHHAPLLSCDLSDGKNSEPWVDTMASQLFDVLSRNGMTCLMEKKP